MYRDIKKKYDNQHCKWNFANVIVIGFKPLLKMKCEFTCTSARKLNSSVNKINFAHYPQK